LRKKVSGWNRIAKSAVMCSAHVGMSNGSDRDGGGSGGAASGARMEATTQCIRYPQ
jgi:hypothetical protein